MGFQKKSFLPTLKVYYGFPKPFLPKTPIVGLWNSILDHNVYAKVGDSLRKCFKGLVKSLSNQTEGLKWFTLTLSSRIFNVKYFIPDHNIIIPDNDIHQKGTIDWFSGFSKNFFFTHIKGLIWIFQTFSTKNSYSGPTEFHSRP